PRDRHPSAATIFFCSALRWKTLVNKRGEKMRKNAADRLLELVAAKKNPTVVGLDPVWERIPEEVKKSAAAEAANDPIRTVARSFLLFNKMIIDAVKEIVPAVKPQFAFYEQYG